MRFDSCQFGSFDGLDNRRAVMQLFKRMGEGVTEEVAMRKRANFLKGMVRDSGQCFKTLPLNVTPCTAVEAYNFFIAITGCLGVPVETAAKRLEAAIR